MKILLVGLGSIGQRHARNLRCLLGRDADLMAFRTRRLPHVITPSLDVDTSRNVEEDLGVQAYTDLHAALKENPEAAFICTPNSMHMEPAFACLRAGCDLFIEKPLSNSMDRVPELISEVAARGRIGMVGYQLRFHPCVKATAAALRERTVGAPLAVRATMGEYMPNYHRYEDYRSTYVAHADTGGGVILAQIHDLDYLYSLFGLPERIDAIGGHWSTLDIDVEDVASMMMMFTVEGRPLPVHLQQDFLQDPPVRGCEIVAERGKITLDFVTCSLVVQNRLTGETTTRSFPRFERNQLFLDELEHFLDCVKTRRRPLVDIAEGAQSLRMAMAAKESISGNKPVEHADGALAYG
jgi:predicted dehydrogenase